jgi:hypothetical protein
MTSLFTVTENEIKNLDQTVATEFFAKLLRSEAYRVGLPLSSVQISTWVNVGDGGVDARVEGLGSVRHVSNIFLAACTSYQIKTSRTGKSFSPTSESDLKNKLFGSSKDTDIKADKLGAETRRCFDEKGVYVLLCFALQLTPQQRTQSEALLVSLLTRAGIDSPQVQVWGFNNLRDFIHPFPS